MPNWILLILAFLVSLVMHDPITASTMLCIHKKSSAQMVSWIHTRDLYRETMNDWFHSQQFDGLIAPTSTLPAPKINATIMLGALSTSTLLYNVLDWPVGVIPVTRVQEGEVMKEEEWKGREGYSWMFLDYCYGKKGAYNDIMEKGVGLPVGVQIVGGRSGGEEGVLAMMGEVVAALKKQRSNGA
jgi:Asp-tRNA(Asn)/Glu-tRNA(Gln) amidotransferase A subunit family amidase